MTRFAARSAIMFVHRFSLPRIGDFLRRAALLLTACGLAAPVAWATGVVTWRVDTASGFRSGERDGVIIADSGAVSLSRLIQTTPKLDAAHVWDLARTDDGTIYAATGDGGILYRRAPQAGTWTVAHDADDTQILSLASAADGTLYAGTGPSGQVLTFKKGEDQPTSSRPDPAVQYIWDLAVDRDGTLYAATGPTGQLWKRPQDGAWALVLDSAHPHLLCVAIGPGGEVYAGSDGEGLLYRVGRDGRVAVLYDAPQNEIRTLAVADDGTVFVGTSAAEPATSGGGSGRSTSAVEPESLPSREDRVQVSFAAIRTAPQALVLPALTQVPGRPAPGGTAAPKPPAPGENAVYRITPEGAARQVFRARVLIFALTYRDGRLLIGTGPEGVLYELSDDARESVPLARLDHGQVLCLLAAPDGETLIGTGEGRIATRRPGRSQATCSTPSCPAASARSPGMQIFPQKHVWIFRCEPGTWASPTRRGRNGRRPQATPRR
jgi:outer membrane protein assembly factor BamB